jgi:hypothetical protein
MILHRLQRQPVCVWLHVAPALAIAALICLSGLCCGGGFLTDGDNADEFSESIFTAEEDSTKSMEKAQ